jgi:hypothetical protein
MPNEKRNLDRLVRSAQQASEPTKTKEQQVESVYQRLLHKLDPVAFSVEALRFVPDDWQKKLLRSRARKIIVNVARQNGKSDTAAVKAVHMAVFNPGSLTLVVAPALPQAAELRRKIDDHLRQLKDIVSVKAVTDNKRELEFDNKSRIVILAADEDTVRSYTADLIIEDESATVTDAVFEAMKPMLLVRRGQHILLGTPKGLKTHHFPDIWHDEASEWEKYLVTAWDNPRVTKSDLAAMREEALRLGRLWVFQQEYECSFTAAAQGLVYPFTPGLNTSPALVRDNRWWQYVLGIDYGFSDSTAYVVMGWQKDDPHVYVVETIEKRGLLAPEAAEIALQLTKKYPFARMVGDMGGFGKGYVEEARRRFKLPIVAAEKNNKRGYIELMASDLRAGLLKVMPGNDGLLEEWQKLPWDESREMPADGHKDHLADAALYAWRATCHYLEEIRKAKPVAGSDEAYQAEAEDIFDRHLREAVKPESDWWEEGDEKWPELPDQMNESAFLN